MRDIHDCIDDRPSEGVFRVRPDFYTDPELFAREQERVFGRNWIFLGIESQIPEPHDYIVSYIGPVPVIVSRTGEGRIEAFLNACRHKGALLSRVESGNRRRHSCPYHGWVYDSSGRNVHIKDQEAGRYSPAFERDDHDLVPLAAFGSYKGLMFGSLSADVPSLEDFLGEIRFFLDCAMEQGPQGMEFVPGRIAFVYEGNWKAQLDNGMDSYHLSSTHTSFMEVQQRRADAVSGNQAARQFDWKKRFMQEGGSFNFKHGHNVYWLNLAEPEKRPIFKQLPEIGARVGEDKAQWMLKNRNLTVFPSMQIADSTSLNIRTFRPLAVDRTEVRYYCLAPIGEPAETRAWRLRQFEDFFNVSGFATPDDTTEYEDMQVGLGAPQLEWMQGYARGMTSLVDGATPLARSLGFRPEASLEGEFGLQPEIWAQSFYREWARLMSLPAPAQDGRAAREAVR